MKTLKHYLDMDRWPWFVQLPINGLILLFLWSMGIYALGAVEGETFLEFWSL